MDERLENISIDSLVSRIKRLGWQGDKVRLDVDTNKEGASKLIIYTLYDTWYENY